MLYGQSVDKHSLHIVKTECRNTCSHWEKTLNYKYRLHGANKTLAIAA